MASRWERSAKLNWIRALWTWWLSSFLDCTSFDALSAVVSGGFLCGIHEAMECLWLCEMRIRILEEDGTAEGFGIWFIYQMGWGLVAGLWDEQSFLSKLARCCVQNITDSDGNMILSYFGPLQLTDLGHTVHSPGPPAITRVFWLRLEGWSEKDWGWKGPGASRVSHVAMLLNRWRVSCRQTAGCSLDAIKWMVKECHLTFDRGVGWMCERIGSLSQWSCFAAGIAKWILQLWPPKWLSGHCNEDLEGKWLCPKLLDGPGQVEKRLPSRLPGQWVRGWSTNITFSAAQQCSAPRCGWCKPYIARRSSSWKAGYGMIWVFPTIGVPPNHPF